MKKSFFRKGASALLAVVMCLSSFLGIGATTAFAAEEVSDTVVMFSFPREGDANFSGNWRHGDLQYMNGWSAGASSKITVYTVGSWSGNACYCIEPGTPLAIGDTMTKRDETYWDASFENVLKRGDLKVIKNAEDKLVEGLTFRLYGTSLSGIAVDEYAVTDKDGIAYFDDILIGTGYTLEEVDTPVRYVIPESQDAVVEWDAVTEYSFENILKKWRADVFKIDSELADIDVDDNDGPGNNGGAVPMTLLDLDSDEMVEDLGGYYGQTQGNATLAGAVYGVYKGEELIDTYTTDENGYFITDYYVCGDDWSIREITPSEGYLLDPTIYYVDCSAENYTVEHNTEYPDVYEQIIKGDISIIKHTDDGSTQIETPEVGAKFEIYLKSAGSYAEAKETERDIIICDEHGFGQTKMLPYGVYTVHQVSGWDGRELMEDFDVFVSQDGNTYRYLINNRNFESFIRVAKIDAETGNTIDEVISVCSENAG